MNYVILDLEWNGSYSRKKKGYINEIIEFGAVKLNEDAEMVDSFSCLVKPQVAKKLNSAITDLTHITDDALVGGVTYMRAVSMFRRWAKDAIILTWGTSDILALIENCLYFSGNSEVPFLHRYCNLQEYVQRSLDIPSKEQLGLAAAATALELDMGETEFHRALEDSILAGRVFQKLFDPKLMEPFIQECDAEFYRRITFKTTYVSDLSSPLVDRKHLKFTCPNCGSATRRVTQWVSRNRSFRAEFKCDHCGNSFAGRLILKIKYEGLAVNRKTFRLPVIEVPRKAEPGDVGSMKLEIAENGVGLLRFRELSKMEGVNALFSTRIGGISKNEFSAMNLGFDRGDPRENVETNYRLFANAAGVQAENMVCGNQDHQTNVKRIEKEDAGTGIWRDKFQESLDGLCTDCYDIPLIIYASDCVPIYFYDREHHAIGLAHAGWKGTAAGMARVMVETMAKEYGSDPSKLFVGIGPSIGYSCFEVDSPVAEQFLALPGSKAFVAEAGEGKYHVDLWECNCQMLTGAGVLPEHIDMGFVCTMCNSNLVFSHRKTQGRRGSNCALLSLERPDNEM